VRWRNFADHQEKSAKTLLFLPVIRTFCCARHFASDISGIVPPDPIPASMAAAEKYLCFREF
jgi:hypothetical protein